MPAGDVAQFVCDHPLHFVGGAGRFDQPGVDIDRLPARDEGVDAGIADEHKLDIRKWSAVSHVVALMYGQLAGCDSLNGIVDAARVHEGEWRNIRGAQPPTRNTFSNANRHRDAAMAERLYWEVFEHLVSVCPGFGQYNRHKGFLARMKRGIFAIDSSTIKLCLNCIDWARHRRKKAAAKLHMNLDVGSRLPAFAVVEDAGVIPLVVTSYSQEASFSSM